MKWSFTYLKDQKRDRKGVEYKKDERDSVAIEKRVEKGGESRKREQRKSNKGIKVMNSYLEDQKGEQKIRKKMEGAM